MPTIINTDTTWTAGQTYTLSDDVQIANGVTLTIEAGAVVQGGNHSIAVFGNLEALGSAASQVQLSNVRLVFGSDFNDPGFLRLDHVAVIGGALLPPTGNGGYGSFSITNSLFTGIGSPYMWYPTSNSVFTSNIMLDSGGLSVGTDQDASMVISDNTFINSTAALVGSATIVNWAAYGSPVQVTGNSFLSSIPAIELPPGYTGAKVDADSNYYGTVDQSKIASLILDKTDDLNRASVIANTNVASVPSAGALAALKAVGLDLQQVTSGKHILVGTTSGDKLTGTQLDDLLVGNGGNDVLNGGQGNDTASFTGKITDYSFTLLGEIVSVSDKRASGGTGRDFVSNVENFHFANGDLSLDQIRQQASSIVSSEWRLFTADNYAASVGGSGTVFGGQGHQDITVLQGAGAVTFDPSFNRGGDTIRLFGEAEDWAVMTVGSSVQLMSEGTVVTIPIGSESLAVVFEDGVRGLRYDTVQQTVILGKQAISETLSFVSGTAEGAVPTVTADATASSRLFLSSDATAALKGSMLIFGTNGVEEISLSKGIFALDASFNRGGDTLHLSHDREDYSAFLSGSSAILQAEDERITIPVGEAGMKIDFAGDVDLLRFVSGHGVLLGTEVLHATASDLA